MNLDAKLSALDRLSLDVAVIPESASNPALVGEPAVTHAWTGKNAKKGLGVFGFHPWSIEPITEAEPFPWCLPVLARHVDGQSVTVLAIWTVKNAGDERPSYAGQLQATIERWSRLIEHEPVIIAGDLNASFQGPSLEPHRQNIETLKLLGARSAFQIANGPVAADDEPPTLRWIGPGRTPYHYHCDYVIVSASLTEKVRSCTVGNLSDWVDSNLSDHCPVVAEIDDSALTENTNSP